MTKQKKKSEQILSTTQLLQTSPMEGKTEQSEAMSTTVRIDPNATTKIREFALEAIKGQYRVSRDFCLFEALHTYIISEGGKPGFTVEYNNEGESNCYAGD